VKRVDLNEFNTAELIALSRLAKALNEVMPETIEGLLLVSNVLLVLREFPIARAQRMLAFISQGDPLIKATQSKEENPS